MPLDDRRLFTALLLSGLTVSGLTVSGLTLAGCKPDAALKQSEVLGKGAKANAGPPSGEPRNASDAVPDLGTKVALAGPTGSITGTVSFVGKPPAKVEIDTSMDPACGVGGAGKVYAEQIAVDSGKLANVFVYLKSGPAAATSAKPVPSQPAVLDQRGCRYVPHVVGVMAGGYVEFRNSDPTMHNIHTMPTSVGNETIDVSQGPKGAPVDKQMQKPELMMPVRCNNHPWMNAFINVSPTPFFAVTDTAGHYSIAGLPPGDYVFGAVQEKLGEKTFSVSVKPNANAKTDLSFAAGH